MTHYLHRFFSTVLLFLFLSGVAQAQDGGGKTLTISLPGKGVSIKKPSSDLEHEGRILNPDEAARLGQSGLDLSTLQPTANKLWQNQSYTASNAKELGYPTGDVGVHFVDFEAAVKFTSLVKVRSNADSTKTFRLGISRFTQPMMMRSGLLRRLGFFIPSPEVYKKLKVSFNSVEDKKLFLEQTQIETSSDFESRNWVQDPEPAKAYLFLTSATLETVSQDYFDLNWGLAPNPEDPNQVPLLQRLSRLRGFRALIFPYSLIDVPESVNRFTVRHTQVQSGFASIPYFMAESFSACTYEDARWILRRLQALTPADFREIVKLGQYPPELEELVYRKLLARVENVLQVFGFKASFDSPDLNFSNGAVKKGKVTQEFVGGYPQRFSHGERQSPYQDGDFGRYLSVEGKSSFLRHLITKMNKRLEIIGVDDHLADYQQKQFRRFIDHIINRPREPYQRKIDQWGGPIGAFNVSTARYISTGTYSGSSAPVQLIDSLSIAGGIGYFHALDGLQKYIPIAGGNLSVARDYLHVRPILSITEGSKEKWKNVVVPNYMKNLANTLEDGDFDQFLSDMRDGEVFTVSDSVALSAYLQASSTLDVLFGLAPFNYFNSVTLGADASRVVLRQVQFVRVVNGGFNGIHVYVREMKNRAQGLELNVDYFINLLKIRSQNLQSNIVSDGFLIEYDPNMAKDLEPDSEPAKKLAETKAKLKMSLLPLFRNNDPELLYSKFKNKKFALKHNLKTEEDKISVLGWKFNKFNEDHLLEIQYPKVEDAPELNPDDEKVILFSHKRGELVGRDLLSLGFEFIDGLFRKKGKDITISRGFGENPANVPFGRAYWRIVNTETDLSSFEPLGPVAIVQHVWGGWSLEKDKFLKVLKELKKEFSNTTVFKHKLIDEREFQNIKSLDFYRITANLSVFGDGLPKLRDLLLQPANEDGKSAAAALVSKVKNKSGRKLNDKELFEEMMSLLGNGDSSKGEEHYDRTCVIERSRRLGPSRSRMDTDFYKGVHYECLTRWMQSLIKLAHEFPKGKKDQTRWLGKVLMHLDQHIPMPQLLNYLGEENYVFVIRINGFRPGDEDGDLQYFSNTYGAPEQDFEMAGGLINYYVRKTGILPTELDRTQGGFQ